MTHNEYNGWTNYETWAVALWLDNEEGSQRFWHDRAHELADELRETTSAYARFTGREIFTLKERVTQKLADELKDSHEEGNPLPDSGVFTDLLNAALSEVNWQEIAQHYTEGVDMSEASATAEQEA